MVMFLVPVINALLIEPADCCESLEASLKDWLTREFYWMTIIWLLVIWDLVWLSKSCCEPYEQDISSIFSI